MFMGFTEIWWKTIKLAYKTVVDDQAWNNFKKHLSDKYIPAHVKRQKVIEFQQLKMANMTVSEYFNKF